MNDQCNATNKNSTCALDPDHDGRHFDPRNGHSWVQEAPAPDEDSFPGKETEAAVHRANCCAVHGCKFATDQEQENECPVSNGTLQQDAPCEHCEYQAEGLRQATDAQIADELTRRGYHKAAVYLR